MLGLCGAMTEEDDSGRKGRSHTGRHLGAVDALGRTLGQELQQHLCFRIKRTQ